MKNRYIIDDDICFIELKRRNGPSLCAEINGCDLAHVASIRGSWIAKWSSSAKTFYAHTGSPRVLLHRWILNLDKGIGGRSKIQVDHDNHNGLDNKRKNLIVCSNAENGFNRKGPKPNTKSGIRGVSWSERWQRWSVRACYLGTTYFGGWFKDLEEAEQMAIRLREAITK